MTQQIGVVGLAVIKTLLGTSNHVDIVFQFITVQDKNG